MQPQVITVSSKGQIAIPKPIRDALNLKRGAKLKLELQGQEIRLSRGADWKALEGAAGGDLMEAFRAFRREEREREA